MKTEEFDKLVRGLILMQQYNDNHLKHLQANHEVIQQVTKGIGMNDVAAFSSVSILLIKAVQEMSNLINMDLKLFKEESKKGNIKFEENGNK